MDHPTADKVVRAADELKRVRPVYAPIIDMYAQIFSAQETAKQGLQLEASPLSEDKVALKSKERFPLLQNDEFHFDASASTELFFEICRIISRSNKQMASSAEKLLSGATSQQLTTLFQGLLASDDQPFENVASTLEIDKKVLAFVTYNSLKPSLESYSQMMAGHLSGEKEWDMGYCPVCGGIPVLSTLEQGGNRKFVCSFCWHPWPSKRWMCPYCENRDSKALKYFFSEKEEEYRVEVCEKCKHYVKTVDMRKTSRLVYLPLEQVTTLHLDIKAKQLGFESRVEG